MQRGPTEGSVSPGILGIVLRLLGLTHDLASIAFAHHKGKLWFIDHAGWHCSYMTCHFASLWPMMRSWMTHGGIFCSCKIFCFYLLFVFFFSCGLFTRYCFPIKRIQKKIRGLGTWSKENTNNVVIFSNSIILLELINTIAIYICSP